MHRVAHRPVRRPPLYRSVTSRARGGDSRPAASTRRPPTPGAEAPASRSRRSPAVGAAVADVAGLATGRPDRDARHRRALASPRVRALLAVEVTPATGGPAGSGRRHPGSHPADARGQPTVGRAAHPRRTAEAGHRDRTDHRGEVPASPPWEAPVADVADVPHESRLPTRLGRLLHGPHRDVSRVVRVRRAVARPTAHRPRERHGASDGRVDRATAPRGVALGLRTAVRHPGSRRHLRIGASGDHAGHGHRRSA